MAQERTFHFSLRRVKFAPLRKSHIQQLNVSLFLLEASVAVSNVSALTSFAIMPHSAPERRHCQRRREKEKNMKKERNEPDVEMVRPCIN